MRAVGVPELAAAALLVRLSFGRKFSGALTGTQARQGNLNLNAHQLLARTTPSYGFAGFRLVEGPCVTPEGFAAVGAAVCANTAAFDTITIAASQTTARPFAIRDRPSSISHRDRHYPLPCSNR
jgi:hypothetical protein